ncbi:RHS repeat-associated core domain-containing protein [Flavobacterium sp. LMO8]|uniref:RHS repeat-associated core domain-containing protein n=1 Tax=Flavobacterium sp. LMO8 TaxID=2654244 RepID=UPI001EEFADD1|nr:RHS repeat-associated core domain-containing protein [Flavobacterium sp. LMO8]
MRKTFLNLHISFFKKYNHLNLPTKINFVNGNVINYLYIASGQKIAKDIVDNIGFESVVTDYLTGGFQYKDGQLQFFPHAEGYVNYTPSINRGEEGSYNYVFNYTDHLGNIRLSYGYDPLTSNVKIMEENHYYPFGLKHTNYNSDRLLYTKGSLGSIGLRRPAPIDPVEPSYKYKYNGKEYQDELGLNMYDFGFRNYDPALGRWMNIDPKAEVSRRWTPYNYAYNNPMYFVDPDGMRAFDWVSINGQMVNDSRVTDQKTATENYGSNAVYRAPGYKYTTKLGNNVVLGENGNFTVNGENYESPDLAPGTLSEVNSASNQAITYSTEGTTAVVASQFKSNDNPYEFNKLKDNQVAWRTKAVLGKVGAGSLEFVKGAGNATAIATPFFHGYEISNRPDGSTTTMEKVDLGVEVVGGLTAIGSMLKYIPNPVSWTIGAMSTVYSSIRYGQSNNVMEDIRSDPGTNGCFAEGTMITMSDGSEKEIQDVKFGDIVLTYNFKTTKLEPKKVLQKINPIRNEIITIGFDNGVKNINTIDHPYFVESKKWSSFSPELTFKNYGFSVNNIEIGDSCFYISNGNLVKVKIVYFEVTNSSIQTYNLSDVEDNNNFFANGILVHNKN